MISCAIQVTNPADPETIERLADTLSALVPGVAAGLIGDAVIVARRATDGLATIAEGSGATLVVPEEDASTWQAAARAARRDWLLCLEAGDVPVDGWIRTLDRFVGTARPEVALGRLGRIGNGLGARLVARGERLVGVVGPRPGDLVRRDRLISGSPFRPRLRPKLVAARLEGS